MQRFKAIHGLGPLPPQHCFAPGGPVAYVPLEGPMQHAQAPLRYRVAVHRADLDIDTTANTASLFVQREGEDTARFVADIRVNIL